MSSKQEVIQAAARAVIEHGGPECRTEPHSVLDAVGKAHAAGATDADIKAEMRRQRGEK